MVKYSIVAVPFPFSEDKTESKLRPVLCLTDFVGKHNEVIVAYITTKIKDNPLSTDILVEENASYFSETGLLKSSVIKLHKLTTISKSEIIGKIGFLSEDLQKEAERKLEKLLSKNGS
jgi:mRNA-degrading endonuclease toxin of MazEF toxin-antitoxin module